MKADELREKYLSFFESKGCVRRPSDVLVPRWDPSVLFTPAGMNQFKDHFLGRCKLEFTRATTCQKCLRTGDIDNVGRTAYHHTFFEMLGNFSFGDYFKREAITWAWEFLTGKKWLGLAPERLSATVYLDDDEAAGIWTREIGLPPEKLQRLGEDENFWPANAFSQGPDGVCGPCSEIYYKTEWGSVEIWNLVFTQFNRVGPPPNNLRPLPSRTSIPAWGSNGPHRCSKAWNPTSTLISFCRSSGLPPRRAENTMSRKASTAGDCGGLPITSAHARLPCTKMSIQDPTKSDMSSNALLRRAVLDGHQIGTREPFLYQLVPVVAEMMKNSYPELAETARRVSQGIKTEEENFLATIDAGLDRVERVFEQMRKDGRGVVAGEDAFEMYQTHGFPPELFENMAAERNLLFDWESYRRSMEAHQEESGPKDKGEVFRTGPVQTLVKVVGATRFVGYESTEVADAVVVGIIAANDLVDKVQEVDHEPITVVLDKTPFYGEMGGQVGDQGEIVGPGFRFEVTDSQIDSGLVLHKGHLRNGELRLHATVTARVDRARRQGIRRAHTATHLLHHVLQKVARRACPAAGVESGPRLVAIRFQQPVLGQHRATGPD